MTYWERNPVKEGALRAAQLSGMYLAQAEEQSASCGHWSSRPLSGAPGEKKGKWRKQGDLGKALRRVAAPEAGPGHMCLRWQGWTWGQWIDHQMGFSTAMTTLWMVSSPSGQNPFHKIGWNGFALPLISWYLKKWTNCALIMLNKSSPNRDCFTLISPTFTDGKETVVNEGATCQGRCLRHLLRQSHKPSARVDHILVPQIYVCVLFETLIYSQQAECIGSRHRLAVSHQVAAIFPCPRQQLLRVDTADVAMIPRSRSHGDQCGLWPSWGK